MESDPKYRPILQALQTQIASGKFRAEQRLPSENELAQRYNVSRPTAARAIRELVNQGLIQRRAGSGTYLRVTTVAPTTHRTVGLLVPGLGNTEILDPICNEISRVAQSHHAAVLWGDPSSAQRASTADEAQRLCKFYIDRQVNGVFFAPLEIGTGRQRINLEIASALSNAGIAVVLLDRDVMDFPARSNFDLVGIDNFHAGLSLASHLLSLGHRRLAFLARPNHPSTTDLRLSGCREAIARHASDDRFASNSPHASDGSHASDGPAVSFFSGNPGDAQFVEKILASANPSSPRPDAIICSNDLTAALLMQTLTGTMHLTVPRDLAVAGFDDVNYSTLLTVPLTTMRQPCAALAQTAFSALLARMENPSLPPRQILLNAELVVRKSCGIHA
jgi:DNA-binding LacI/PurR family transcriptional regulator